MIPRARSGSLSQGLQPPGRWSLTWTQILAVGDDLLLQFFDERLESLQAVVRANGIILVLQLD